MINGEIVDCKIQMTNCARTKSVREICTTYVTPEKSSQLRYVSNPYLIEVYNIYGNTDHHRACYIYNNKLYINFPPDTYFYDMVSLVYISCKTIIESIYMLAIDFYLSIVNLYKSNIGANLCKIIQIYTSYPYLILEKIMYLIEIIFSIN